MFDNKLKDIRKEKGIGQVELAEYIGVTQPFITQIENGTRPISIPILISACDKLGCTPNDILGYPKKEGVSDAS